MWRERAPTAIAPLLGGGWGGGQMSASLRLTIYAAIATIAAAMSLASVYSSSAWAVPVIGAVLLVSGACALIRWSPLPSALEPLSAAIAVLLWVTALDAHQQARFGFIPGRAAVQHLGRLARHGFTDIHKLPTPVPTHKGLVLLTVVGVAAVALVVDLLAVTLRRAALAGLPLLALFTICAASGRAGVNVIGFIVASVGYLLLLYTDNRERVTRWGAAVGSGRQARPASAWSTDPATAPPPAALGRRVGAAALGVSVLVPLVIPGLHSGIGHHHSGGGGSGGGNVHTFDPFIFVGSSLHNQVTAPILTYTSTTHDPGYLRLTSLDSYSNGAFSATELRAPESARVTNGLGVSQPSATNITTRVAFSKAFPFRWLPMPTTAVHVAIAGDWRYDPATATVFSASTTTAGSTYTVVSSPNLPTPAELAADGPSVGQLQLDLLTPNVSPRVKALTQHLTSKASSNYDVALDIQHYLTSNAFTYDTNIHTDNGPDPLGDFLFRTHRGFCQQFATAMAVMARLSGIPSRVAVGFTAGTRQPNGSYLVTSHDAHTWPELWFPKYGWLAFEPTPRRDGQAQTPSYARARAHSTKTKGGSLPTIKPTPQPSGDKGQLIQRGLGASGQATGSGGGVRLALLLALIAAVLIVAAVAAPGVIRWTVRRRRWRRLREDFGAIDAAWAELRDSAIDIGAPWDDAGTPRTLAAALVGWTGPADGVEQSLATLTRAEEQDRYAATPRPITADLRRETETVRAALARDHSRRARLLVVVLPRSTRMMLRSRLSLVADRIEWLERAPSSAARQLNRRLRRNG